MYWGFLMAFVAMLFYRGWGHLQYCIVSFLKGVLIRSNTKTVRRRNSYSFSLHLAHNNPDTKLRCTKGVWGGKIKSSCNRRVRKVFFFFKTKAVLDSESKLFRPLDLQDILVIYLKFNKNIATKALWNCQGYFNNALSDFSKCYVQLTNSKW